MANKSGSSWVPDALIKGEWKKDKNNENNWIKPSTGEKLTATHNYIQRENKGWENVGNKKKIN